MSKETLRKYLLTSSAEAIPQARRPCSPASPTPKTPNPSFRIAFPPLAKRWNRARKPRCRAGLIPLKSCWIKKRERWLSVSPTPSSAYAFPACSRNYSKKRPGNSGGKGFPSRTARESSLRRPPCPSSSPLPKAGQDALHPAVANPMPFGEEWTFDTFIGNGSTMGLEPCPRHHPARRLPGHAWPCAFARRHRQKPRACWCSAALTGPARPHLLRAIGNELFRTLGSDLYYASLSDLELLFAGRAVLAAGRNCSPKKPFLSMISST